MFYQIFAQILRMSITASIVIVAVLVIRSLMHRLPKKYLYLLWLIVGIRLSCPIAVPSPISLFNLFGQSTSYLSTMNSAKKITDSRETGDSNLPDDTLANSSMVSVQPQGEKNENAQAIAPASKETSIPKNNSQATTAQMHRITPTF